jgi:hypothetical protein
MTSDAGQLPFCLPLCAGIKASHLNMLINHTLMNKSYCGLTMNRPKTIALPTPPLKYYPPPPSEPVWRNQRQRHHASSLHQYVGDLFAWLELCRREILFHRQVGLPVAAHEQCDDFVSQCLDFIRVWTTMLESWNDQEQGEW